MTLYTPGKAASAASSRFAIYTDDPPDMISLGLGPIDRVIGGMLPKQGGCFMADQGVGKSSTILTACFNSAHKHGILSLEDPAALVGTRVLSAKTGINGLDIMRKNLTPDEKRRLKDAEEELRDEDRYAIYEAISPTLDQAEEGVVALAEAGCRLIWVDYIQKIRGVREDRNNEVATSFTRLQGIAARNDVVMMAVSQVTNVLPGTMPRAYNVRETRDIANESRFILAACRPFPDDVDPKRFNQVDYYVEKCTHGGGGLRFSMLRDKSGTLREVDTIHEDSSEEEW